MTVDGVERRACCRPVAMAGCLGQGLGRGSFGAVEVLDQPSVRDGAHSAEDEDPRAAGGAERGTVDAPH